MYVWGLKHILIAILIISLGKTCLMLVDMRCKELYQKNK